MLELAYKRTRESDVEVFEILYGAGNWKPIFTQKWASLDMNWGGGWAPGNYWLSGNGISSKLTVLILIGLQ